MEFSVELNGIKHTYLDDMSASAEGSSRPMESLYGDEDFNVNTAQDTQPRKIDTLAIYFANQRPFDLITFSPARQGHRNTREAE